MSNPKIREEWKKPLAAAFASLSISGLSEYIKQRKASGIEVYPQNKDIFAALDAVAPDDVKVVILGQDPYHGPGQAHGYAFSVPEGVIIPPSLANIYKELNSDLGVEIPKHGSLEKWAKQGVLLLNTILTVERSTPLAHKAKGWESFTDAIIRHLSESENPTVFILWGSHAQKKGAGIDESRHLVIREVHPSPLSAHRGFFGSKPFSKANKFLEDHGRSAIDWNL